MIPNTQYPDLQKTAILAKIQIEVKNHAADNGFSNMHEACKVPSRLRRASVTWSEGGEKAGKETRVTNHARSTYSLPELPQYRVVTPLRLSLPPLQDFHFLCFKLRSISVWISKTNL